MRFDYSHSESAAIQATLMGLAADPSSVRPTLGFTGASLAQWQMGALVDAELLAARCGLVPTITADDGTPGVVDVGRARDHLDRAEPWLRALYLGTHHRVGQTIASVQPKAPTTPTIGGATSIGFPLVWPLVVLGVAALVAGAWYAVATKRAEVELAAHEAISLAQVRGTLGIAHRLLDEGKPIPADLWQGLLPAARQEEQSQGLFSLGKWPLALLLAGAAYAVWTWLPRGRARA